MDFEWEQRADDIKFKHHMIGNYKIIVYSWLYGWNSRTYNDVTIGQCKNSLINYK